MEEKRKSLLAEVGEAEKTDLWEIYDIELKFRDRVIGSIPKDEGIIEKWLESKGKSKKEKDMMVAEMRESYTKDGETDMEAVSEEVVSNNGFRQDETGYWLPGRTFIACMRDAAKILKATTKTRGLKDTLYKGTLTRPERLYFYNANDKIINGKLPTQVILGHVMTPSGPMDIMNKYDYIEGAKMKFKLLILQNGLFSDENLMKVLHLTKELGLGGARALGNGHFDFTRVDFLGK